MLKRFLVASAACLLGMWQSGSLQAQPFPVNWVGEDGAAYDDPGNWDYEGLAGVPSFEGDFAVIGNATRPVGVATLNTTLGPAEAQIAGMTLGSGEGTSGTLNMSSGSLEIVAEQGVSGIITVGSGGTGVLNLSGGTLSSSHLVSNSTGNIHLSDTGSLSVSGVAYLGGVTSITGTSATLNMGTAVMLGSSAYSPTITGAGVVKANVAGDAALGGSLNVTFSGVGTPSPGATWDLIEAGEFYGPMFNTINVAGIDDLPVGQRFRVASVPTGGDRSLAQLQLVEVLRLQVDRNTGAMGIVTGAAGTTEINGYQITAGGELFDFNGAWTTLSPSAGWEVANASAMQLAEINSTTAGTTVSQANPLLLGNTYAPDFGAFPFGQTPGQNLSFTYNTTSGETVEGVVEFVGDAFMNNFVLTIDPDDGMAELKNDSNETVTFDTYSITSAAGALSSAGWEELGGDWQVANPTLVSSGAQLAELNPVGDRTLAPGQRLLLGSIFPQVGSIDAVADLAFFASNSDPLAEIQEVNGVVRVGQVNPIVLLEGDFNGDGVVDAADYTVWRNNLGANSEEVINNAGNNNGVVDADDYVLWKANFGLSGGAAALAAGASAVPEPGTFGAMALALLVGGTMAGRRPRRLRA